MSAKRVYIIAGEASGDLHASNLMKALLQQDPDLDFRYFGGERMEAVGGTLVQHYRDLSYMGFWEVLANIRSILGHLKHCKEDMRQFAPDALILVDFPSFNLRVAELANELGIPVFYYISPQIWAWKRGRVHKIKRLVRHVYTILPFENNFYKKYDVPVTYVGHPLLDAIQEEDRISKVEKDTNLIALLPGSRKLEIEHILPIMTRLSAQYPDLHFVCAGMSHHPKSLYEKYLAGSGIELRMDETHQILRKSRAAIVASGTATLETALFRVPQVVAYKGSWATMLIAGALIKVKYISLVNLILDRPAVKELIQHELNLSNLQSSFEHILQDEGRERLLEDYKELHRILGSGGASENTAKLILGELNER